MEMQTHFFRNYEAGRFGMDTVVTCKTRDEPYFDEKLGPKIVLNKEFLEEVIEKEKYLSTFLSDYYNASLISRHNNANKVCKIRELEIPQETSD